MFQKGECVVYGNSGVCEIADITVLDMDRAQKGKLYYKLTPYQQGGGIIYSPVDSQKIRIRKVVTKNEAEELLDRITDIDTLWITDEKQRERHYREAMNTCDLNEWIRIIKTLYDRKKERLQQGKKVTAVDSKYLKLAEDNLYSELSVALGIDKEKMGAYITSKVKDREALEV